jgi:hypothetical protein
VLSPVFIITLDEIDAFTALRIPANGGDLTSSIRFHRCGLFRRIRTQTVRTRWRQAMVWYTGCA